MYIYMVYLDMVGRCGNQLFQYSFARQIMLLHDDNLTINLREIDNNATGEEFWENSLSQFNICKYFEINTSLPSIHVYGSKLQKLLVKIVYLIDYLFKDKCSNLYNSLSLWVFRFFSRYGIYYLNSGYTSYHHAKTANKFIYGYFEDIRWFSSISDIICKEFVPRDNVLSENFLFDDLSNKSVVCMSLRRWDISVDEEELISREVCSPQYYKEAIEYITNYVPNPIFYVCSNDIGWAEKYISQLQLQNDFYFESGNDSISKKLSNMSKCKHFILSNSTFCWWAQYLSPYNDRIVISPSSWSYSTLDTHLIDSRWILL